MIKATIQNTKEINNMKMMEILKNNLKFGMKMDGRFVSLVPPNKFTLPYNLLLFFYFYNL